MSTTIGLAAVALTALLGLAACGGETEGKSTCDSVEEAIAYKALQMITGDLTEAEYQSEAAAAATICPPR